MRPTTSGASFAAANAAMVRGIDSASTVHVLLADCLGLLGADTAGVLVRVGHGLELMAATSHKTIELELHQAQMHDGPCVDTITTGESIEAAGPLALTSKWPEFGRSMADAGFQTVLASPMRWHSQVLGGLNLFWKTPTAITQDARDLAQAFADISSLALMQSSTVDNPDAVTQKMRAALRGRVVIERAKGVLAQTENVEMDQAFARLVEISDHTTQPLSQVAQQILDEIVAKRP